MTSNTSKSTLPAAWGTDPVDEVDGLDQVDKDTLVGVPFLITGAKFRTTTSEIPGVEVEALDADGNTIAFFDTSPTGVRGQLLETIAARTEGAVPSDTWIDLRIACVNGLRVSRYPSPALDGTMAQTHYLTANGKRSRT